MKVLIINANVQGSSTGKIAYGFYKQLKTKGHEVRLAFGMGNSVDPDDNHIIKISPRIESMIHFRYNLISGYNSLFGPIASHRLNKLIDEFDPDIIQLYNIHGYYLNTHSLFKKLSLGNRNVVY